MGRDKAWYYRLSCGHLRLIEEKKKIELNETSVYCRKCDAFSVVTRKESELLIRTPCLEQSQYSYN